MIYKSFGDIELSALGLGTMRLPISLAKESGVVVLSTDLRMFETCGKLYAKGLKGSGEVDE